MTPVRTVGAKLSMLTSVELEHTEILGPTEELIACDKVDALAAGGRLVISPAVSPRLLPLIESYARLAGRTCHLAIEGRQVGRVTNTADGASFSLADLAAKPQTVRLQLIGAHQVQNALTALRAAELWLADRLTPHLQAKMLEAIGQVRWAGRLERVARSPDLWIDVGPHARRRANRWPTLSWNSCRAKRCCSSSAPPLRSRRRAWPPPRPQRFDDIILTCPYSASADVGQLASVISQRSRRVVIERDVAAAARLVRQRATAEGKSVIALGGTLLAAKMQHAWTGGDPDKLEFL